MKKMLEHVALDDYDKDTGFILAMLITELLAENIRMREDISKLTVLISDMD